MQMIEESAGVAASHFFNHFRQEDESPVASSKEIKVVTARFESVTFQQPLHIGDVGKVKAQVVFASDHTVAVSVKLLALRPGCKEDAVGNRALLWVVGLKARGSNPDEMRKDSDGISKVQSMIGHSQFEAAKAPKLDPPPIDDKEAFMAYKLACLAYQKRKSHQQADPASLPSSDMMNDENEVSTTTNNSFTPDDSAIELAQVMLPGDCINGAGLIRGGVVMKLMDNASGVAAVRHCGTNIVTVSVDAVDLVSPVLMGDVLRIRARPTFTSSKSIEIQVVVIAERFTPNEEGRLLRQEIVTTSQAYFTFVSLGVTGKALPMRPLEPANEEDNKAFQQGKLRYEQRKAIRAGGAMKK